jgi:hypothetical protein
MNQNQSEVEQHTTRATIDTGDAKPCGSAEDMVSHNELRRGRKRKKLPEEGKISESNSAWCGSCVCSQAWKSSAEIYNRLQSATKSL